jgi:FHS family L-fucose permease-like MFS transporter
MSVTTTAAAPSAAPAASDRTLFLLSLGLFFLWGFATVLIDILVPKLKGLFALSYAEVMLTQFAFFLGYLVFSLPAGSLVSRLGYMRGIVVGLAVMTVGCLLFAPAARLGIFSGFLLALFIMAAGITILQVAANAVIAIVGPTETGSARLTLAQGFNSLGTTIGPLIGAKLILEGGVDLPADVTSLAPDALAALRVAESAAVQVPFLGIAALLVILLIVFWVKRDLLPRTAGEIPSPTLGFGLLANRRLLFGVIAIFTYVGAEVSIGSLLANYLMLPSTIGVSALRAGQLVSLYWGGAMVGRFIGSFALSRIHPGKVLAGCGVGTILLAGISALTTGGIAAGAIIGVGLFNSIMFPTIFALSVAGFGKDAPKAAALLCTAIVGGAIVPVVTGAVADQTSLAAALIVPIVCYGWIVFFGRYTARTTA